MLIWNYIYFYPSHFIIFLNNEYKINIKIKTKKVKKYLKKEKTIKNYKKNKKNKKRSIKI